MHSDISHYRTCVSVFLTLEELPSIHAISVQTLGGIEFSCELQFWLVYFGLIL